MRLFVALEVEQSGGVTDAAPTHLTLRFLGEVTPERIDAISEAIEGAIRGLGPYDLILEGVGAFPSPARPRVVWVGATRGSAETMEIARRISSAFERIGFPADREGFVPHVTLFRVRSEGQRRRALALLSGQEPPPPPRTVRVREVVLKESTLTPGGAFHRTVRTYPLAGTPRDLAPESIAREAT